MWLILLAWSCSSPKNDKWVTATKIKSLEFDLFQNATGNQRTFFIFPLSNCQQGPWSLPSTSWNMWSGRLWGCSSVPYGRRFWTRRMEVFHGARLGAYVSSTAWYILLQELLVEVANHGCSMIFPLHGVGKVRSTAKNEVSGFWWWYS